MIINNPDISQLGACDEEGCIFHGTAQQWLPDYTVTRITDETPLPEVNPHRGTEWMMWDLHRTDRPRDEGYSNLAYVVCDQHAGQLRMQNVPVIEESPIP